MSPNKELVLSAGLELLARDGLAMGPDSLRYAAVFRYLSENHGVHVTRGSVHERIWADHEDYRRDVLAKVIQVMPAPALRNPDGPQGLPLIGERLAEDPAERIATFVYANIKSYMQRAISSLTVRNVQAVVAVASRLNDVPHDDEFHRLFEARYEAIVSAEESAFPLLLTALGLQPRAALGLTPMETSKLFYGLVTSLTRGLHCNHNAGYLDGMAPIAFRSAPGDGEEAWIMPAVAVHAFLSFLTEASTDSFEPIESIVPPPPPDPPQISLKSLAVANTRRTRSQLKELVLQAGVEVLMEGGLDVKPTSLRYSAVLAHLESEHDTVVHRSSIRRSMWPTQEDFQRDVFIRYLSSDQEVDNVSVASAADGIASSNTNSGVGGDGTIDQAIVRTMSERSRSLLSSLAYKQRLLIKASMDPAKPLRERRPLEEAVAVSERQRTDVLMATIAALIDERESTISDQILSAQDGLEAIALVGRLVEDGALFDELAGIKVGRSLQLPRLDQSGQKDHWTLSAVAVKAVTEQMFTQIL